MPWGLTAGASLTCRDGFSPCFAQGAYRDSQPDSQSHLELLSLGRYLPALRAL